MSITLQNIQTNFAEWPVTKKWYRHLSQRAAVSIILRQHNAQIEFLMMQRSLHENDPWSGQMAFPGGKQDCHDRHITETAQREAYEEMGIPHHGIERIGRLSDILARPYRAFRNPMVVSPLVFKQLHTFEPRTNEEVADWLWLPVDHFIQQQNRQKMTIEKAGLTHQLPCYYYQEKCIWGLSLLMIDELLDVIMSQKSRH